MAASGCAWAKITDPCKGVDLRIMQMLELTAECDYANVSQAT